MSYKLVINGQANLVDESTGQNLVSFPLTEVFQQVTGIREQVIAELEISSVSGVVPLQLNGVSTVRALLIWVVGAGEITVKHDANTVGIKGNAVILEGLVSAVTIETLETQNITVKFVVVQ